jgi:hypothetical protein
MMKIGQQLGSGITEPTNISHFIVPLPMALINQVIVLSLPTVSMVGGETMKVNATRWLF